MPEWVDQASEAANDLGLRGTGRVQAEKDLARSYRLVAAVGRVSARLLREPHVQALLDELGAATPGEQMGALVLLRDAQGLTLTLSHTVHGPDAEKRFGGAVGFPLLGESFAAGQQPFASALTRRKAMYLRDHRSALVGMLAGSVREVARRTLDEREIGPAQPAILVPLIAGEKVLGILMVVGPRLLRADVPILTILADLVTSALERARLGRPAQRSEIERESDRMRSQLVADVSHEMRTPLGLIEMLSSSLMAEDIALDPKVSHEFLAGIREAAETLTELVENLLEESRLEQGSRRTEREPLDLGDLVRSVAQGQVARSRRHTLALELEPGLVVEGDAVRLQRVLINLLSNAVQYSPAGGQIYVAGRAEGDHVVLSIRDEGIGIPEWEQAKIFERFYRVQSEWTSKVPGMGLGLAVSRGIVRQHGGQIWVESRPGEGSTFYTLLPLRPDAEDRPPPEDRA